MICAIRQFLIMSLCYVELTIPILILIAFLFPFLKKILFPIVMVWLLFILSPLPYYFLIQLENTYPKRFMKDIPDEVEGIILLGGSHDIRASNSRGFPVYLRGARFLEAAQLLKKQPHLKVVLSGKGHDDGEYQGEAHLSVDVLKDFGISDDRILLETKSRNTFENAQFTADLLGEAKKKPWLLVTSAFHMRRAMPLFEKHHIYVIPYPVDYHTPQRFDSSVIFSSARFSLDEILSTYRRVVHEFLGACFVYGKKK